MSSSMDHSSTIRLKDNRVLYVCQPREDHEWKWPIVYLGEELEDPAAISKMKQILEPYSSEPVVSCQRLNYAMCEMQKALTKYDEQLAIEFEEKEEHEELMLSYHVGIVIERMLPRHFRDGVHELLRDGLRITEEEHLTDAKSGGLSGFTLEALRVLRCHVGGLGEKEMDLLMELTLSRSTPQLARGLKLIQDI